MKEFLILKNISSDFKGINATVKITGDGYFATIFGTIYLVSATVQRLKAYLETERDIYPLLNGESLHFEKKLRVSELERGFTVVVIDEKDFSPILYANYKRERNVYDIVELIQNSEIYNDEEIASVNYYKGEDFETKHVYSDVHNGDFKNQESPPKITASNEALLHEEFSQADNQTRFYDSVKDRFDQIIYCHEKDLELCSIIPNGEFVKINYDSDRYYSVGRVMENGEVKYLCYAVKCYYGQAPEELKKYCKFIPLSPYRSMSEGFYTIFQSALDGKVVVS